MRQNSIVRTKVFETNSSSTHSISIADASVLYDTMVPNANGEVVLTGGRFGWELASYNDVKTKANYAAIDYKYLGDMSLLTKVIKDQTQCDTVVYELVNGSYIDHYSVGLIIALSENELREFIFNPQSRLFTDNDNR